MNRSQPKRDWSRVTVNRWTPCLICGREGQTERAHVAGRAHDRPDPGQKVLRVDPLDIVPLCGPATDSGSCHFRYDNGRLDLLEHLTVEQQARVVRQLGGIENARMRLAPSDYTDRMRQARIESRVAA